ncbi:MAG: lytic transglycosylase domain-containing protein [Clostridiales bacterium]|nr:lytic transglycosylase domain-containing protein [Clostridiales bacterium]
MLLKRCVSFLILIFLLFTAGIFAIKGISKIIYPKKYQNLVETASVEYDIDKYFIYSVIKVESSFNERVVSSKGAVGLMQITPSTAEYIAKLKGIKEYDLFDAKTNIDFGAFYLKYLINKFQVIETVVVAYNAGETRVSAWLKDNRFSTDGKRLNYVPYKESREYLEKVIKAYHKYKKLYI